MNLNAILVSFINTSLNRIENRPVVQFICQHAPPLINHLGDKSRTPLHIAVACGNKQTVQICLKNGADAEKRLLNILSLL